MAPTPSTLSLHGGGPWGFRLYGGAGDPLVVAKLRKRSKAGESGLQEGDVLMTINGQDCGGMSHGQAMAILEGSMDLNLQYIRGGSSSAGAVNGVQEEEEIFHDAVDDLSQPPRTHASHATFTPRPAPAPAPAAPAQEAKLLKYLEDEAPAPAPAPAPQPQPQRSEARLLKYLDEDEPTSRPSPQAAQQHSAPSKPLFQVTNVAKPATATWTPTSPQRGPPPQQRSNFTVMNKENYAPAPPPQSVPSYIPESKPVIPRSIPNFKVAKLNSLGASPQGIWTPDGIVGAQPIKRPSPQPAPQPAPQPVFQPEAQLAQYVEDEPDVAPAAPAPTTWSPPKRAEPAPAPSWQPIVQPVRMAGPDSPIYKCDFTIPDDSPEEECELSRYFRGGSEDSGSLSPSGRRMTAGEKKIFADSSFYDDAEHKYPTIEEQIKMARKVALSLVAPANQEARGQKMFMKRRQRADKWITGDDLIDEAHYKAQKFEPAPEEVDMEVPYYQPNPWEREGEKSWSPPQGKPGYNVWQPTKLPEVPRSAFKAPTLPSYEASEEKRNALSADEFERMRLYESKTQHNTVAPEVCFSLADDLKQSKGKGAALFAKRRAKADQWVVDESNVKTMPFRQKLAEQVAHQAGMPPPAQKDIRNIGLPQNRLQSMIEPPKAAMTPWDAAAEYGSIDVAFSHINPYQDEKKRVQMEPVGAAPRGGLSHLELLTDSTSQGKMPPPSALPTYNRKVRPWRAGGQQQYDEYREQDSLSEGSFGMYNQGYGQGIRPVQFSNRPVGVFSAAIDSSQVGVFDPVGSLASSNASYQSAPQQQMYSNENAAEGYCDL